MNPAKTCVWVGLLILPVYAQPPSARGVNLYSINEEVRIGASDAARLARSLPIVHEPKLDEYIAKLVAELAPHASRQYPYTFSIYDDRRPLGAQPVTMALPRDAFRSPATEVVALTGGPMLVPLSLLAGAQEEAEVVYQLAHAMAHIGLRHATRLETREQLVKLASTTLKIADGTENQRLLIRLGLLSMSRRCELDADSAAVAIMAAAGYNPEASVRHIERQFASDGRAASGVFAAEPAHARRVRALTAAIEKLPPRL